MTTSFAARPPEVLKVREAPDPEPKAGEVRIRVEASGVNFADILGRMGLYPDLPPIPVVPGYEQVFVLEAAAIPINYFTAWQLVVVMGGLKRNETVLIHSVGGGVGIAATQIAKHLGARVIGTTSASKHAELRATEDFEKRAREITNGRGVELILDAVGDSLKKGYRLLAPTGRLGMFGISAAASLIEAEPVTNRLNMADINRKDYAASNHPEEQRL